MNSKLVASIKSMRLRTLPLALSGTSLGILLAYSDYKISFVTSLLIILTTVCLQILSNLSNELGDVLNGTDTLDRQGPQYGLNGGILSIKEMKRLIRLFILLSIVSGMVMIYSSFGTFLCIESICLLLLGACSIFSSMHYTLGNNPYGYRGLGDLFVFIYFGIVSVLGSYFVSAHAIPNFYLILPAISMGLFGISVLNINNIRDMKTDKENRVTVAIKLGERGAKIYETIVIVLAWVCMLLYSHFRIFDPWHYLYVLSLPLYIFALKIIWTKKDKALDPALPLLVISTLIFALLAGFGFIRFLL